MIGSVVLLENVATGGDALVVWYVGVESTDIHRAKDGVRWERAVFVERLNSAQEVHVVLHV